MEQLKQEMIAEAKDRNGVPLPGKTFEECFTYEPYFKALILWVCVDGSTRMVARKQQTVTTCV